MMMTRTGRIALTLLASAALAACGSDDDGDATGDDPDTLASAGIDALPEGLMRVDGVRGVSESIAAVQAQLMDNAAVNVRPVIDHAANAATAGLELPPTQLLLFGNPALGSQLMAINPVAGLDLPQKLLAWEGADGTVHIDVNSAAYVAARHGVEDADAALEAIAGALAGLSAVASGTMDGGEIDDGESDGPAVTAGQGVMTLTSERDAATTYDALVQAISSTDNPLSVIAEVDHQAAAAGVDIDLDPLRLVVFGNPAAGTPLMQDARTVAIDLPQKMLVYENADGEAVIAWNDPAYLAARHGITDRDEALETISGALAGLAAAAAAAP